MAVRVASTLDESASAQATPVWPTGQRAWPLRWPIRPILGFWGNFWGAKFPKM